MILALSVLLKRGKYRLLWGCSACGRMHAGEASPGSLAARGSVVCTRPYRAWQLADGRLAWTCIPACCAKGSARGTRSNFGRVKQRRASAQVQNFTPAWSEAALASDGYVAGTRRTSSLTQGNMFLSLLACFQPDWVPPPFRSMPCSVAWIGSDVILLLECRLPGSGASSREKEKYEDNWISDGV